MAEIPYVQSNGDSKILDRLCVTINQLIDGGGGGGGSALFYDENGRICIDYDKIQTIDTSAP